MQSIMVMILKVPAGGSIDNDNISSYEIYRQIDALDHGDDPDHAADHAHVVE